MTDLQKLEAVRQECRTLVRKRALVSAGAAMVPVPFMDVMVDASILMQLIPEISRRFGLEPEHIAAMTPEQREKVWHQVRVRGSQLIGIVLTRAIVRKSFMDFAGKLAARQISKFIPFGGQLVAAGLGYFVMRRMAYKHIDDCFAVVTASS
ncbi:MAG: hypothetical protein REI12_09830 [Pedobacter sp.]|nr:hypothetical protein [Pedobacter sp.]